jgi:hypothetical protein
MHRIRGRVVLALVIVGALAAGGAAYTNSITGTGTTNNTAGYAGVTVNGAVLADAVYGFDGTGANITGVTLTFTGALTGDDVKAGFNGQAALTDCGTVAAGNVSGGNTTMTCSFSPNVATSGATQLNVLVSNT